MTNFERVSDWHTQRDARALTKRHLALLQKLKHAGKNLEFVLNHIRDIKSSLAIVTGKQADRVKGKKLPQVLSTLRLLLA